MEWQLWSQVGMVLRGAGVAEGVAVRQSCQALLLCQVHGGRDVLSGGGRRDLLGQPSLGCRIRVGVCAGSSSWLPPEVRSLPLLNWAYLTRRGS